MSECCPLDELNEKEVRITLTSAWLETKNEGLTNLPYDNAVIKWQAHEICSKFGSPALLSVSLLDIKNIINRCQSANLAKGFGNRNSSVEMDEVIAQAILDFMKGRK